MHPAELIVPPAKTTMNFAEALIKEIEPAQFGRMPDGVKTNSPAFAMGHLAIYPAWIGGVLGIDVPTVPEGFDDLFKHGAECRDDADGSIYPSMDAIMSYYRAGHNSLIDGLAGVDASKYAEPNPSEGMRDMAPTCAALANFMLTAHAMMHLGQVSAWRRCMGMGPCF